MDKQRCIAAAAETEEDRLLLTRLYDKLNHGAEREIFSCTAFLSPREQAMVKKLLPMCRWCFSAAATGRSAAWPATCRSICRRTI